MQFIFGYGSLLNPDSRARTAASGTAIPARVRGYARAWNVRSVKNDAVVLGVVRQDDAVCNGVLVPVSDEALAAFDERERSYERIEVSWDRIQADHAPEGTVWIYVPLPEALLREDLSPSVRYVEVCLAGARLLGEGFEQEFREHTLHWHRVPD